MPEDPKNLKSRQDPKEQRKPRRQKQQTSGEKKVHKNVEEQVHKNVGEAKNKVPATASKPVIEEPGPEFYKNLKRETDEILKISEEANSKYKKKEIQSNWAKYEMPIESYDETEEQDVGADYEKLVQTPMSIGGHFQFKHEKSWDVNVGPSPYDKYFEIDMTSLATALNTIPFYERNGIDLAVFSESDKLSMENRAVKYRRKYFDDKCYTTAEIEAQEKIESKLSEALKTTEEKNEPYPNTEDKDINLEELSISSTQKPEEITPITKLAIKQENYSSNKSGNNIAVYENKEFVPKVCELKEFKTQKEEYTAQKEECTAQKEEYTAQKEEYTASKEEYTAQNEEYTAQKEEYTAQKENFTAQKEEYTAQKEDFTAQKADNTAQKEEFKIQKENKVQKAKCESTGDADENISAEITSLLNKSQIPDVSKKMSNDAETATPASCASADRGKADAKPVIESPEDLEKWLDDFLDG